MKLAPLFPLVIVGSLFGACSSGEPSAEGGEGTLGSAQFAIVNVPANVTCIRINAKGSRTVAPAFDVTPGASSVLRADGLPTGGVDFTADAFNSACSTVTAASAATWKSPASVHADLAAGTVTNITLSLVPSASASVSVDFDGGTVDSGSALGTACMTSAQCQSGFCTDGVCCSVAMCASGTKCGAMGACIATTKANGAACATNAECQSGFCTDGVCCNTACTGQCQACDNMGSAGTCSGVNGQPHGARTACVGAGTACGGTCNAMIPNACTYPTTSCGTASCMGNTLITGGTCNAGMCGGGTPISCGLYACVTGACRSSCMADSDCSATGKCVSGVCVAR